MRYVRLAPPTIAVCMVSPRIPLVVPQLTPPLEDEADVDPEEPELDEPAAMPP
jgi:hypothetical protein